MFLINCIKLCSHISELDLLFVSDRKQQQQKNLNNKKNIIQKINVLRRN